MKTNSKFLKNVKLIVGTAVFVLLILIILGEKISFFEKKEDKSTLIGNAINSISQLATTEYDYTYIDEFNDQSKIDLFITKLSVPLTSKYFVGAFEGSIKYGIDLNKITKDNIHVNESDKVINIDMPEVIKIGHETEKTVFFAVDNSMFNPFTPEDGENFKEVHKIHAEEKAIERGILKRIQKDTEKAIKIFISNLLDFEDYEIKCNFPKQDTIKDGKLTFEEME